MPGRFPGLCLRETSHDAPGAETADSALGNGSRGQPEGQKCRAEGGRTAVGEGVMNRKRKKPPASRNITIAWLVCMAVFVAELFFYTWCRVQYTHVGYDMSNARATQNELNRRQQNLNIELEYLKSPERIAKIAEEYLGLTLPKPEQTVTIQ
jgi:cell division protein FtsL